VTVPLPLPLPNLSRPVVLLPAPTSPAWKSIPTAREVPDTGTRASDLSLGSRGMPRIPSWTEYKRKEPTPARQIRGQSDAPHKPHAAPSTDSHNSCQTVTAALWRSTSLAGLWEGSTLPRQQPDESLAQTDSPGQQRNRQDRAEPCWLDPPSGCAAA